MEKLGIDSITACEDTIIDDGVVEYWIYPDNWSSLSASDLRTLKSQLEAFVKAHVPAGFLWNGGPFVLEEAPGHPGVLRGQQYFGGDMQDEWFVVHLLFALTEAYPHISARVADSDGEFLLIEASEHLPEWLTPETAANRVFVRHGRLCVLSIPQTPADLGVLPLECPRTPEEGLTALLRIEKTSDAMELCSGAQKAVASRIGTAVSEQRTQRARAVLPLGAAHAIRRFPQLGPHAANAFRGMDLEERRECVVKAEVKYRDDKEVNTLVCLTRFTYAELMYTEQKQEQNANGFTEERMARALGAMLAAGIECLLRRGSEEIGGPEEVVAERDCADIRKAFAEVDAGSVPPFPAVNAADVDSDEWMDADPDEFDAMLRAKTKEDLVDDVKEFMNASSEYDGVRCVDDSDDDNDDDDDDDSPLSFDPERMIKLIKGALLGETNNNDYDDNDYEEEEREFQEEMGGELKKSTLGEICERNGEDGDGGEDEVAAQCLLNALSEPGNPLSSLLYMSSKGKSSSKTSNN